MDYATILGAAGAQIIAATAFLASPDFQQPAGDTVGFYWAVLSGLTVYAAIAIFISSADDAFLDLYYWVLTAQRFILRPFARIPSTRRLHALPQKKFAVMIPAWKESEVIARMLMNTLSTIDYERFDVFVGVYPNDPETIAEVEKIRRMQPRVIRADVGHAGPTSKADCLNWIIANITKREADTGEVYDAILMHDSEDVIHPMSFKVVNAWLDRADMIQLPVMSMNRKWNALVACHYMDEFAEWHGKDLVARSAMTDLVPSAGVATAFSRRSIQLLCDERDNLPFNTDSLTEDYDVGHRLWAAGMKSAFVRYWARMPYAARPARWRRGTVSRYRKELVCTREFFPDSIAVSVRQKSRWMLGISFLGWEQLGWTGPAAHRYFLYRDRKAIWTAPTGMLAYLLVFQWLLYMLIVALIPVAAGLPPLIDPASWIWVLVMVNFVFLVNRVCHRVLFTGLAHGPVYAVLAPVRMVLANYIGFLATWRAGRRYLWRAVTGERISWDKTQHAYPSMAELNKGAVSLGEVLKFHGAIDDGILEDALAEQARRYRPLGLLLLDRGRIEEGQLAAAFSELTGLPQVECDPLAVQIDSTRRLPLRLAERHGAAIAARDASGYLVALAEPVDAAARKAIEAALDKPVRYGFARIGDIAFAHEFGWDRRPLDSDLRAARILTRLELIDAAAASAVWRRIRSGRRRLGDLLVRRGALGHDQLVGALAAWPESRAASFADHLLRAGLVRKADLDAARLVQAEPPFGFVRLAQDLGYLDAAGLARAARKEPALLEDA